MEAPNASDPKPYAQWRLIAAMFAAVTAVLAGWYFLTVRQDYTLLYRDLRSPEAAAIISELDKQGLRYRLSDDGTDILVPASQADAARSAVAASNVGPHSAEGFELFNESDMGLTEFAQKIRYQRALQGELARTIMMMDGVVEARVHISMPERTMFRGERTNAEAAVTLVTRSPADETPERTEGIQRLVAASTENLSASDVVVINAQGDVISPPVEPPPSPAPVRAAASVNLNDIVRNALRRALPDLRYEASIDQAPTPSQSASVAASALPAAPPEMPSAPQQSASDAQAAAPANAAELAVVAPPGRVVRVATESTLTSEQMDQVNAELRQAGIADDTTVSFRVGLQTAPAAAIPSTDARVTRSDGGDAATRGRERGVENSSRSEAVRPVTGVFDAYAQWIGAGVIGVILIIAAALAYLRAARATLTPADHDLFAEKLRSGLRTSEQGGVGGAA